MQTEPGTGDTLRLQYQNDGTLFNYQPGNGYPAWRMVVGEIASGDAQPDDIMRLCWNCTAGAGRENLAYPASGVYMERHWDGGAHPQAEFHLFYTDLASVEHRVLSFEGHDDNNTTSLFIAGNLWQLTGGNDANTPNVAGATGTATTVQLFDGSSLRKLYIDGSTIEMFDASAGHPAQISLTAQTSVNGSITMTGDDTPATDDTYDLGQQNTNPGVRWRNAYISRVHGGCNTAANRPNCTIGAPYEGAWYSTCSVPGVSNGVEAVCHCSSAGACAWAVK
jgi:hypothetical protein